MDRPQRDTPERSLFQRHRDGLGVPSTPNRPRGRPRHRAARGPRRPGTQHDSRRRRPSVNSARILLASANDRHPGGLANGSDQAGRNYLFHNSRAFLAISTQKSDTRFQKTLGLNDYCFGDSDFGYPMGNLQMVGKSAAPMYRGEKPIETALAPTFALGDVAEHAVDFWLSAEDLPDPDNRVKKHLSRLGMHPHHLIPRDVYMQNDIPVAGCAHQAGTVRFGRDPATSVLDTDCKAHEVDNLYVVDTSFFPSIGVRSPSSSSSSPNGNDSRSR
ncbi:GMC oxidoreductase [Amycolatopsis sp. NPDC049253]|uniref:GMC oxidoreductase n=1 Tax=Amycolatopsis sp. NPDC049253 TaxID=3155274 RepID=UPI0034144ED1